MNRPPTMTKQVKFQQTTLANGLTIIGETRESAVSAAIGFFVRTGARDETAELSGVSHFLEHMMFKGTAKRSTLQISFDLGRLGAQANAYTSEENTVYYMAILPEYFREAVELLSDMMTSVLDEKEFDTEKNVILEEIALYKDRPTHVLFEAAMKQYFGEHSAGSSVIGSTESVSALTRTMMWNYFTERYVASNMVLVGAGKFQFEELVALAEEYCGKWPKASVKRECLPHVPKRSEKTLYKDNLQRAHLVLVGPGPSAQEELRYSAEILSCILGDSSGSRAYWELVDKGIADAAFVDVDDMDGTGVVYGYVSAYPDRLEETGGILRKIMESPDRFRPEDLARAKTKIGTRLVLQGESSMRRLMAVGLNWIYRSEYQSLADELLKVQSVTRSSIDELLARYSFSPTTKVKLLPAGVVEK